MKDKKRSEIFLENVRNLKLLDERYRNIDKNDSGIKNVQDAFCPWTRPWTFGSVHGHRPWTSSIVKKKMSRTRPWTGRVLDKIKFKNKIKKYLPR